MVFLWLMWLHLLQIVPTVDDTFTKLANPGSYPSRIRCISHIRRSEGKIAKVHGQSWLVRVSIVLYQAGTMGYRICYSRWGNFANDTPKQELDSGSFGWISGRVVRI